MAVAGLAPALADYETAKMTSPSNRVMENKARHKLFRLEFSIFLILLQEPLEQAALGISY